MPETKKMTFGLIVGNRGFFPDALAQSGREDMIRVLKAAGHKVVIPGAQETKVGAISNRQEAHICANLFRKHRDEIDGIILTLPNFGEETAIVETLKVAALNVPVLIQATPDEPGKMTIAHRRDSFCGKMSACSDLRQIDIPYTLTKSHTVAPDTDEFKADLERFAAICRVVNGLRNLRVGAIGARPAAFNTVRYSEKLLALSGIDVEPIDLSEILGRIERMKDNDDAAQAKLADIKAYVSTQSVPAHVSPQDGQARRGDRWLDERDHVYGQRHPVLDRARRVLRRGALHRDEHDEQQPSSQRVRGGRLRRGRHAGHGTRLRHAQRSARLEQ